MRIRYLIFIIVVAVLMSCGSSSKVSKADNSSGRQSQTSTPVRKQPRDNYLHKKTITVPFKIDRDEFVAHAESLQGIPYVYGGSVPSKGLDCSGFVYYLFNKHNAKVPRVSRDFTDEGIDVKLAEVKPGDFLLFTGSDNSTEIVGHMGIVVKTNPLSFVHASTSQGVTTSVFRGYWKEHFVKAIQLLR